MYVGMRCTRARACTLHRRYGEGFDYNTASADYWLIEIAAAASGLSADMLRSPADPSTPNPVLV